MIVGIDDSGDNVVEGRAPERHARYVAPIHGAIGIEDEHSRFAEHGRLPLLDRSGENSPHSRA